MQNLESISLSFSAYFCVISLIVFNEGTDLFLCHLSYESFLAKEPKSTLPLSSLIAKISSVMLSEFRFCLAIFVARTIISFIMQPFSLCNPY